MILYELYNLFLTKNRLDIYIYIIEHVRICLIRRNKERGIKFSDKYRRRYNNNTKIITSRCNK